MADWRLVSVDPAMGTMKYELYIDENTTVIKTETYAANDFFALNKARRDNSAGQRFGDGQVVASMPLHVYFDSDLFKAQRDGDDKWAKKFLNDLDNRAYRTFRGDV